MRLQETNERRRRRASVRVAVVLALGVALVLPGCDATRSGANPELPTWKNRAGWALRLNFERSLVAKTRRKGEPYERGTPEIDPQNRRVFVGSSDGGLYALSAVNGETLWRFETLGFVQCAPLYDEEEDVVYFGSNDGALYKVHAMDGQLIWRLSTNAEVARQPILSGGMVYFANANDTLVAADRESGKVIWSQHRTPALGMEVAGYAGPALSDGLVYMGFSDGTATAFDAVSGDERWQPVDLAAEAEQQLGDIPQYLDVDTTPIPTTISAGRVVIFGSYAGGVFALDAASGTQVWTHSASLGVSDFELWEQPAHKRGDDTFPKRRLLLVATGTTGLWALDPDTGEEIWRKELPAGGVTRPVPIEGALLVNATQLGTFLLSPVDGSLIDGIHLSDGASSVPAAYGSRAFILSNGGSFLGLQVHPPKPQRPEQIGSL